MKNKLTIICFLVIFVACKKSVFVPDASNNLLPEYSETGRNIAGALLNDTAWRCEIHSCFSCIPWRFYIYSNISGDSTVFRFEGLYTSNSLTFIDSSFNNVPTDFYFVVKGLKLENQDSLLSLNDKTFQFDGVSNYSGISKFDHSTLDNKGIGTLVIKRVQKGNWEFGDGSVNNPKIYRFVISGYFNLQTKTDELYNISDGRFDMEVYLNANFGITN